MVDALADAEPVRAGEVIRIRTTGGGGWGDPLDRPYDEVLPDVGGARCRSRGAWEDYGVVVTGDPDDLAVDRPASDGERARRRAGRSGGEPFFDRGPGYARLSAAVHTPRWTSYDGRLRMTAQSPRPPRRVLIALGGNAMTSPEGGPSAEDQIAAIARAAEPIADVVAGRYRGRLTHGNGPQVGNLLVKNELAASVVPPVPLDWCGAQTQGTIGAMLLNAVERSLAARGVRRAVAALVTRTRVDPADPHFSEPTKPIGRYLPEPEARVMIEHGQVWEDRGEKGWRRVVASPEPLEILDAPAVAALLSAGYVVVAAGGGGIPVVRDPDGSVRGVEAVIDKDLSAALLARAVGADVLVIATDVPAAALDFGTPHARPLGACHDGRACAGSKARANSPAVRWGPRWTPRAGSSRRAGSGRSSRRWTSSPTPSLAVREPT